MKKFIAVMFLLTFNSVFNAQVLSGYGIKLGLGITNSTWGYEASDWEQNWDNKAGLSLRAFADFLDYSYFNLEGEAGFSQKGVKGSVEIITAENPDGFHRSMNNRLNYLSASLMGKLKYKKDIFTPYLLAGPQFNFLAGYDVDPIFKATYDRFEKSLWGFTVGMGSVFKIEGTNLLLEYRFERDFTNNLQFYEFYVKNYSHSFLIGVQL